MCSSESLTCFTLVLIPSRTLWGSWAQRPFCVPHFLIIGNRLHSASMTFPEFQWGRFKQMLIREGRGCRDKGGTVRRTNSAALGQGPGSPSRDTQTISLSCFADTESPTRWEKLTVCCPQARRPQTGWNQKVDDADSHLPHHQPIRRMSTS